MVARVNIQEEFLMKGGILLKKDINSAGEPVILQKKRDMDWHIRLTFTSETFRDKNYNYLTTRQKKFFRRG